MQELFEKGRNARVSLRTLYASSWILLSTFHGTCVSFLNHDCYNAIYPKEAAVGTWLTEDLESK